MTAQVSGHRQRWLSDRDEPTLSRRVTTSRGLAPIARHRRFNWVLAGFTLAIVAFGIVMVFSAARGPTGDTSFGAKQLLFGTGGLVGMVLVAFLDYRRLHRWYPLVLAGAAVLLVAVLTPLGTEVRGTKGWFRVGGLALQPAEFAKLAVVIGLAVILQGPSRIRHRGRPAFDSPVKLQPDGPAMTAEVSSFGLSVMLLGVAAALVLAEGETGTVLVFCAMALGMMITAGTPVRYLLLLVASGVAVISLALTSGVLAPYQVARFEAFLNPDLDPLGVGYNQQQAMTAIGSGGLRGAGLFHGPQTQLGYLPDQHTDFIFAAVAEELGFVGAAALLALEAAVLAAIFVVGHNCRDRFGQLLCAGVFSMLAFQVFQNVAMNLRLMPITGIALPFVSYGGSSLVTSLLALGLVQSVAVHRTARRGRYEAGKTV